MYLKNENLLVVHAGMECDHIATRSNSQRRDKYVREFE